MLSELKCYILGYSKFNPDLKMATSFLFCLHCYADSLIVTIFLVELPVISLSLSEALAEVHVIVIQQCLVVRKLAHM